MNENTVLFAWGFVRGQRKTHPQEMKEITLSASPQALRKLAQFLQVCADDHERTPDGEGADHFRFFDRRAIGFDVMVNRPVDAKVDIENVLRRPAGRDLNRIVRSDRGEDPGKDREGPDRG